MAPFWAAEESYAPEVAFAFDEELPERLQAANRKVPVLATGAGHGAGVLAGELPTVTRFVRNPTGVSHSPDEFAERDDCLLGVDALATVLADLSGPS